MKKHNKYVLTTIVILLFLACVKSTEFEPILDACSITLVANASFAQVKDLYNGELLQIQEDLIIEGYIISSDRAGNFFSILHFQDSPTNPTEGFQIEIDLRESHLFFEEGSRILIKLKGLYLGQSRGVFRLGGTFAAFGTTSVGRLPALQIPEHIFLSCDEKADVQPQSISIDELNDTMLNTLVRLDSLQIIGEELSNSFALLREETERTLEDCLGNQLVLLNSGFADFQAMELPDGNGAITGVLLKERDDYLLIIRDLEDIEFSNERCIEIETQFTSNTIFISELADPNNNVRARFVELYNSSNENLDLNGWTLRRYTNDNTEISSTIDLTGFTIAAENTLVISPNADEFELVYGFAPDIAVGTNSPADSNGDDNLELVDPFGTIIDAFGVVGQDGSSTNHEFEDGRAFRNLEIIEANPIFTFSEWMIFNDTGAEGTINLPQNAPEDFTPSIRN